MSKSKGVVAAGHELTARAAAEILEDGGNAFDACVAGLFMTFVAEAVFASPGGGGFLMARREGSGSVSLFDFFAETPRKRRPSREIDFYPIHADFGPAKQEFHIGLGSSATPGPAERQRPRSRPLPLRSSKVQRRRERCRSRSVGRCARVEQYTGVRTGRPLWAADPRQGRALRTPGERGTPTATSRSREARGSGAHRTYRAPSP